MLRRSLIFQDGSYRLILGLIFVLSLTGVQQTFAQPKIESNLSCRSQFAGCPTQKDSTSVDVLRALCETRRQELKCEELKAQSSQQEKEKFLSCQQPDDVCDFMFKQKASLLYTCGAAIGGVLIDSALGLVLLPKAVWDLSQKVQNLPEAYRSCSSDFQAKLMLLGELRPKDMTDQTIERLSCGEIKKFIDAKVSTILSKLEQRRQDLATSSGKESTSLSDLKLSPSDLQALNYDQRHSGPLKKAQCFKAEEAAKLACQTLTNAALTVSSAAGTATLVRVFTTKGAGKAAAVETKVAQASESSAIGERSIKPLDRGSNVSPEHEKYNRMKTDFHTEKTEKTLTEMGVKFQKLPKTIRDKNGQIKEVMTNHQMDTPIVDQYPNGGGELYYVRSVPRGAETSSTSAALKHSDLPDFLKTVEKEGYGLVVDSTLSFPEAQTVGRHVADQKMLMISPDTSWAVLQHEYQHALFANHIAGSFEKMKMKVQSGENLSSLISEKAKAGFSSSQIKEMEKLMKAGVDSHSVNERLATMKELDTLGWKKITTDGIIAEKYGLEFTRDYLAKLASQKPLSQVQQQTLNEVNSKIQSLDRRQTVISTASSPVTLGAGAASAVFGAAMYLNKDGSIVFQDPETKKWVLLKGK